MTAIADAKQRFRNLMAALEQLPPARKPAMKPHPVKPRLSLEYSILYKREVWFCRGGGSMGLGWDQQEAYASWWYRYNERNPK